MSKKSFITVLILSVVVTYGGAYLDFVLNISKGPVGLPFGFAYFNFLGSSTDQRALLIDIAVWFVVIFGGWKVITSFSGRGGR